MDRDFFTEKIVSNKKGGSGKKGSGQGRDISLFFIRPYVVCVSAGCTSDGESRRKLYCFVYTCSNFGTTNHSLTTIGE